MSNNNNMKIVTVYPLKQYYSGYVRGSPNGKVCKSTNGTVGTIFTNGNQKTLNAFLLPMVPLVPTVPLVDHMVEFLSY